MSIIIKEEIRVEALSWGASRGGGEHKRKSGDIYLVEGMGPKDVVPRTVIDLIRERELLFPLGFLYSSLRRLSLSCALVFYKFLFLYYFIYVFIFLSSLSLALLLFTRPIHIHCSFLLLIHIYTTALSPARVSFAARAPIIIIFNSPCWVILPRGARV